MTHPCELSSAIILPKLGFQTSRSSLKWQSVFKQTEPLKEKTYFNKLFRYDNYHMHIMVNHGLDKEKSANNVFRKLFSENKIKEVSSKQVKVKATQLCLTLQLHEL